MGLLGWLTGPSPEQKQFDEALAALDEQLRRLFRNAEEVTTALATPPAVSPEVVALLGARNLALHDAARKRERLPFNLDGLAAARARISKGTTDVEVRLHALELAILDFYVSEKTYLELRQGYEAFASKVASAVEKMPELLSAGMEQALDSIGRDLEDVGMAVPAKRLLDALAGARRVRSFKLKLPQPKTAAASPWLVKCFEGVMPAKVPALDLPPDDRVDWPSNGGASLHSPLFSTPRRALEQLSFALDDEPAAQQTTDRQILRVELPLRALDIAPAEMVERKATYLRVASRLLSQHSTRGERFERWELRVLALHLADSLKRTADPELAAQGGALEVALSGRGAPAMGFSVPEMPISSEEPRTSRRRLSRHRLLALAAEEAWKDGVVDERDGKLLDELARLLRLPAEDVAAASEAARARREKGLLGSQRKLDPVKLYAKAAFLAYGPGEVGPSDEKLLVGLRRICGIDDAMLERVMRAVRAKRDTQ